MIAGLEERAVATEVQVVEKLKTIFDPEIPINIYDLGLIYDVRVDGGEVCVEMTFTSESCPAARQLPNDVRRAVGGAEGVERVDVEIVFDPVWHPSMISAEAQAELGITE